MKKNEMPVFGNLQGIKVLSASSAIAGPFSAGMFSEQGADVIQIESVKSPDMLRNFGDTWSDFHKNQRGITLDVPNIESRPILEKLIKWADILIESSKGGTWKKWGLSDEVLWEMNPKLVITHISGFGQTGDPEYIPRASFDVVGQAFSGYMSINGEPDPAPPYAPKPFLCDYTTALFAAFGTLAAYYRAKETGKGESLDVAQFETLVRMQGNYLMDSLNKGTEFQRMGNKDIIGATDGTEKCKDGRWYYIAVGGAGPLKKLEKLLGLEGDPDFIEPHSIIARSFPERAAKFNKAIKAFCLEHTPEELDEIFSKLQIPSSPIMTYKMMMENPHYQAREVFIEWEDPSTNKQIKGPAPVPKFKNNPSRVFRGGPTYGQDNEDVFAELGFNEGDIQEFYNKGLIKK
ncbi:MAG: CoA transferase [Deferribacterales bacterium]|jgi:L-carnitine CoA-transferase